VALRKDRPEAAFGVAHAEAAGREAPIHWICLALVLAIVTLAARIASTL
jgi:hypothetical protein